MNAPKRHEHLRCGLLNQLAAQNGFHILHGDILLGQQHQILHGILHSQLGPQGAVQQAFHPHTERLLNGIHAFQRGGKRILVHGIEAIGLEAAGRQMVRLREAGMNQQGLPVPRDNVIAGNMKEPGHHGGGDFRPIVQKGILQEPAEMADRGTERGGSPDLAKEWNYNRNHNIDIESVMPGSKQKVWWICEKGHEWQATLISRNGGRGCPICNKERSTSFPEQAIFYYVKKFFHDAENRFYLEDKLEIDVYIPSEKIAIEYDGSYYHKSDRKKIIDEKKNQKLRALDLIFIRIVEESVDDYSGYPFIIGCERVNSVSQVDPAIKKLFSLLNKIKNLNNDPDIDSDRDRLEIFEQYVLSEKKNSIAVKNPELISEWHPIKNGTLKPEFIQAMSNKSLWWKCNKCGYEWKAPAYRRTKGMGCPACSGNVVAIGINDLPTTFPDLIIDWDYDKNLNIDPHNCSAGSNQKIWWKCHKCSFSWQTAIANRTRGTGCPKCSGKVVTDETSFAALYPQLVKQWDTDLNHDLSPTDFLPGSEQKIWWRCEKGHLWKCSIANRTHKNNCPYCGNKKLLAGFNDFATIHPELLEEWDDEKNPMEFLAGSNQKVRWICNNGHHWYARISNRIRGEGCPYCNGKRIAKGETDLETKYPVLALEWNYQRNNDLKPSDVTPGSNKKVWWKCSKCNNEWEAIVWSRVRGRGCPFCAGVKPIVGTNDLVTVRPDLMEEWNTEKNSSIDPTSLMPNSRKTVWWKCRKCNYEWQSSVGSRSRGQRCPKCSVKEE